MAYLEIWFDADKKFNLHTADDDTIWLNMYARYNPFDDLLNIECEIEKTALNTPNQYFNYVPTTKEEQVIKQLITQKCKDVYNQTPREFCMEFNNAETDENTMGGI